MPIQTFTLENGIEVLLEENHASKVISFNALVKVGSADEKDSEAGICHVIEHMLFKGTPTRPTGTIARDVEASGGEINAYTSIDQTVFYINMATRFADRGIAILADAIQNPLFDAEELAREKEVILEEIRREKDNPSRMSVEQLFRAAFRHHSYGRPVIGFPETVRSFTREGMLDFHRRWYSPKNMSFIAVGDFETQTMLENIRHHFGPFRGVDVQRETPSDTTQHTPAVPQIKAMNIQSAYMAIGFPIPNITHPDIPSLDVLAHIIGGADSSRLEQEVKEKQRLAHNIYAYAFTPRQHGLFIIGATLPDGNVSKAIAAICREVEKIRTWPVTSEELSRAKVNIRSNEIYEKETVGGQASKIAHFLATAGSHEFESRYYQMLTDVSSKSVHDVAERYLTPANSTIALLVPEASRWTKDGQKLKGVIRAKSHKPGAKVGHVHPQPRRIQLKNGATMIVIENHNLPLVTICAMAPGGTRFETKRNNGVSGLFARAMTKGTSSRTAIAIARDIEKIAGHIEGFAGRNTVGLKCEFLSDHLRAGFELFADVLTHPSFAANEVTKERNLTLRAIRDQEDQLSSLAFAEFLKALFPNHPYGLRSLGTRDSVKGLGPSHLARYHRDIIRSGGLVLAIVGDVSSSEAEGLANELLSDLPRGRGTSPMVTPDPCPKEVREVFVTKRKKQQAHIVIGFQGTTYKNRDRYTMAVLNNILSGQGGRLFLTLRDKMGLAYAVSSVNQEGIEPGYLAVYIGTEPGKQKKAIQEILNELGRIRTEPVSHEEIERSKQYLVGAYEIELQRLGAVANIYAFNEVHGIAIKEVERYPSLILSVTREDVLHTAQRYIHPEAYTLAVVRPG